MIAEPLRGAGYFFNGLRLINQPGLRRFVVMPLTINTLVFAGLLYLLGGQFSELVTWLLGMLPSWLSWLEWVLWLVFGLSAALIAFYTFSIIANLIAAPFNGVLAEAVEKHLTGQALPAGTGFLQAMREAPQALMDEVGKQLYFIKWLIPLLLLFVVPVINLAAPFLWALFSAWMLALEYNDYPMGNHGMKGVEQRQVLRQKRMRSLGFGGVTLLANTIPLVNFLVMPAAVAGATAMWLQRDS